MHEVVCDTSSLQYLHQLGLLQILPDLAAHVTVPRAVVVELSGGRSQGLDLPDLTGMAWLTVRAPARAHALPLGAALGPGETEVPALALETPGCIVVLHDGLARRAAETLGLQFTGPLGLLLDAKRASLVEAIAPLLDRPQTLRSRIDAATREAILRLAGEGP